MVQLAGTTFLTSEECRTCGAVRVADLRWGGDFCSEGAPAGHTPEPDDPYASLLDSCASRLSLVPPELAATHPCHFPPLAAARHRELVDDHRARAELQERVPDLLTEAPVPFPAAFQAQLLFRRPMPL